MSVHRARSVGHHARAGLLLALLPIVAHAQRPVPGAHWDTLVGPGRAAWSTDSLRAIGAFVESLGSGAVVVVEDGRLVAAWGEPARPFPLASVRKSLLAGLLGIEVARGRVRLDARLADLGIDDDPPLETIERSARVRDLLASRSGIYHEAAYEPGSMRAQRPTRGSARPGARWFYNNWDFNTLGTIYEHATGRGIFDGFAADIARPIGMEDFRVTYGEYVRSTATRHPAYTFRMSARDLARYVLLYLDGGRWGDRQIVPRDWVALTTRAHSDAGGDGAYGMLWWVARDGKLVPGVALDSGAFAARGSGPHYAIAIPSRRILIVHLANTAAPNPSNWVDRASVGEIVRRVLAARSGP